MQYEALLGAGITGSILHSTVQLPVVTGCGGLAFVIFSLQVGVIFAESVCSTSILSREGEGAGGADLQRVQSGMFLQALEDGRLSCVRGAPIAADSMQMTWHQGQGQSPGSFPGVYVVICITPY